MNAAEKDLAGDVRDVSVCVVIPVLNEAHVLRQSVNKVRDFLSIGLTYPSEIVVADNGSTDGTLEVARQMEKEDLGVRVLHLQQRGRGRALRQAWSQSSAEILCYTDVDLSTDLSALPVALEAIVNGGADLAVGSRLLPDSRIQRCMQREVISRVYNWLVKSALHTKFSDAQCGFKVITREAASHLLPLVEDQGWFFDTELLVLAERMNFRIADVPVIWDEDRDTRVKFIRTMWDDLRGIARLRKLIKGSTFQVMVGERGKPKRTPERDRHQLSFEPASDRVPASSAAVKSRTAKRGRA